MYLSGSNGGCGCDSGLGDYFDGYLGADPAPWYENLILAGERIATTFVDRPNVPNYPTYGPTYTPPMFPSSYPPAGSAGSIAPAGGLEDYLPWLIGGGLALYLLTR